MDASKCTEIKLNTIISCLQGLQLVFMAGILNIVSLNTIINTLKMSTIKCYDISVNEHSNYAA